MNKKGIGEMDFEAERAAYYKKHPAELKELIKAIVSDFNEDESFDTEAFIRVLRRIAKIQGMSKVAKKAQIKRESLYQALSEKGNPSLKTFANVTKSLGFRITLIPEYNGQIHGYR